MTAEERRREFERIEGMLEKLETFKVQLNYSDIIEALQERYEEMIENNNESRTGYDLWENNNDILNDLPKIDLPCNNYTVDMKFTVKSKRENAVSVLKHSFEPLEDFISEIEEAIDTLRDEYETVIQNCEDKVMLQEAQENNEQALNELEELDTEKLEQLREFVDNINSLEEA